MTPLEEMAAKKAAEYARKPRLVTPDYEALPVMESAYAEGYKAGARDWVASVALKNREIEKLREENERLKVQLSFRGGDMAFPFRGHPLTCGGPDYPECERRNGTGEGELTKRGGDMICPCGKYTQAITRPQ